MNMFENEYLLTAVVVFFFLLSVQSLRDPKFFAPGKARKGQGNLEWILRWAVNLPLALVFLVLAIVRIAGHVSSYTRGH